VTAAYEPLIHPKLTISQVSHISERPRGTTFPVLLFLDSYIFTRRRLNALPAPTAIPAEFYELLENTAQTQREREMYFNTIHLFFPIGLMARSLESMEES
jgi:hypothetical protein